MEVDALLHRPRLAVGPLVWLGFRGRRGFAAKADDERRTGLIDENIVGLVYDRVMVAALDVCGQRLAGGLGAGPSGPEGANVAFLLARFEAIAQIVETE